MTWTINALATETEFERSSIKKWLSSAGKKPVAIEGREEHYRLRDFIDAVVEKELTKREPRSGQLERKTKLQADILEVELARVRNEVVEAEEVFRVLANRDIAIRRIILTSSLPPADQDQILRDLVNINIDDIMAERQMCAVENNLPTASDGAQP